MSFPFFNTKIMLACTSDFFVDPYMSHSPLADIRRDYGHLTIDDAVVAESPFVQFQNWFDEIITTDNNDPTAMVLSTVDEQGFPDSRVVLLKGIIDEQFLFYTNYTSAKAIQMAAHPQVAVNFYWPQLTRQVRIRGWVEKTSAEQSDEYFYTRPHASQIGAIASHQSQPLPSRRVLQKKVETLEEFYQHHELKRPDYWGGYQIKPELFEFWQGGSARLHDRIQYVKKNEQWLKQRLAP